MRLLLLWPLLLCRLLHIIQTNRCLTLFQHQCPSCTLRIEIIYDEDDLPDLPESDDEEGDDTGEEGAKKEKDGEKKMGKDNAGQEEKKEDDDELAKSAQKKLAI